MRRVPIPARANTRFQQEVVVVLGDEIEDDYEALPEEFPASLPDRWVDPKDRQEKTVRWVSNFRLEKRAGVERAYQKKVPYHIELEKQGETLLASYGGEILVVPIKDIGNNRVQANLEEDDPAIGWI